MEKLEIDTKKIKEIGEDGKVFFVDFSKIQGDSSFLYRNQDERLRMDKKNILYFKGSKNTFSIESVDDNKNYGLKINVCMPLIYDVHNLYYVPIEKIINATREIMEKIKDATGIKIKLKDLKILNLEIGLNIIDSDISGKNKILFEYIAGGFSKKYKVISSRESEIFESDTKVETMTNIKGYKKFIIYCKTSEMIKKRKIMTDKNITRIELKFDANELIKEFGNNDFLNIYKNIYELFEKKIEKMYKNIEISREKSVKFGINFINEFKNQKTGSKKIGLIKELQKIDFFSTDDIIKSINFVGDARLKGNKKRYIKKLDVDPKGNDIKFEEIILKFNIFFQSIKAKLTEIKEGIKTALSIDLIDLKWEMTSETKNDKRSYIIVEDIWKSNDENLE